MLLFSNPGIIDLRAALTFGVNAKLDEGATGQFGTGLKYAIACTLRAGGTFTVYRGEDRHVLSTREMETRGKVFAVVTLDGEDLSFTTHLGINWEPWQVYRKLVCNAQDEGGAARQVGEERCRPGETYIHVGGWPELEALHPERDSIILPTDRLVPMGVAPGWVEFYPKYPTHRDWVFNRGVRAGELDYKSDMCTYNLSPGVKLTEDRTFASSWSLNSTIANGIMTLEDPDLIRRLLRAAPTSFEGRLNYASYHVGHVSKTFLDVVEAEHTDMSGPFNNSAVAVLRDERGKAWGLREVVLSPMEESAVGEALALLKKMGYEVQRGSFQFVETLGPETLGLTITDTRAVFISRLAIDQGMKRLTGTILEEHLHAHHGYLDTSRSLQNYLLDRTIDLGARLHLGRVL